MKYLLAICLSLFIVQVHAQADDDDVYDTARRIDPLSANIDEAFRSFKFTHHLDSSLLFFSQYDKLKRNNTGIQNLGDIGTPYINQTFSPNTLSGFITGFQPYGNLFYHSGDAKFHSARLPYTDFRFAQGRAGQRGLIDFEAMHTQNFGENIGITAQYHSTAYDGFYNRQSLVNKNLLFNSYFRTKNHKYQAVFIYVWNKAINFENGGLERSPGTDSFFRSLRPSVRAVDVMLNNAKSINRQSEIRFQQAFALLSKDSAGQLFLAHNLHYFRQSNYYTDESSDYGYYDSVFYFNNNYSNDSIGFRQISNSLELFTPLRDKGLAFKAGIQHDRFTYRAQAETDNYFLLYNHNTAVYTQFHFGFLNFFNSTASGKLFFEGYNAGDYNIEWNNKARLSTAHRLDLIANVLAGSRHQGYQQVRQLSNHYVYQNNFENTAYKTLQAGLEKQFVLKGKQDAYLYGLPKKQYAAYLNYHLIDNYVYYDKDARPKQGSSGQSCLQFNISAHFNLRKFQLHQEFTYQTFSKQLAEQVLLPAWMSKGSYYFQTFAFKKATFIQIGFDATISANYQARIYNPAIMQFQLSDKNVGAYPFLDFFIHAEVKTARIFFRVENLAADVPDEYATLNYYYTTPYYPGSPRRFRLGFAWKFYY